MNIKVRLLGFWRRHHDILFLCAWGLALAFWLHTYSIEIGSSPMFFGAYAVAGVILVIAQAVFVRSSIEIPAAQIFEIWAAHHPDEFAKLAQEYKDGEFTVFSEEIGKMLEGERRDNAT
jgi:hypothetical protein